MRNPIPSDAAESMIDRSGCRGGGGVTWTGSPAARVLHPLHSRAGASNPSTIARIRCQCEPSQKTRRHVSQVLKR